MFCKKWTPAAVMALILVCLTIPAGAATIASWDFDAKADTPTQGVGAASLVLASGTWLTGKAPTGSPYPSYAWGTYNYPDMNDPSHTRGVQFSASTYGYNSVSVSFDSEHDVGASRYVLFEVSADGGNTWTAPNGLMDNTVLVVNGLMGHSDGIWHHFSFVLAGYDNNAFFQFQMLAVWDPVWHHYEGTMGIYDSQQNIYWENVTVSGTRIPLTDIQKITEHYIPDVPDVNQPCANPLNVNGFTNINFCAPTSALNITEYWDVIKGIGLPGHVDGSPNPGPTSVLQFIGWWMNTNDDHAWDSQNGRCPYRVNGYNDLVNKTTNHFNGTALQDCTVGLAQYVRWDDTHDFWANPPALLNGKKGYDWTVTLFKNPHLQGSLDWGSGWSTVVSEINAHRPLIAVWDWWNPINPSRNWNDGFTYCDLGPNIEPPPDEHVGGHAVTIVGYIDDGGGGMGRVVAHDNWYTTDRDIVMKWKETGAPFTHCAALITANPYLAPTPGTLTTAVGTWNPPDQNVNRGAAVVMAQISLSASNGEDIAVNAIKLTAAGSGNDWWDISEIDLVWDTDNDGIADKGDVPLLIHMGGYPGNNGTLILKISGDSTFKIAAGTQENLLVVYHISPLMLATADYRFTLDGVMATGCTSHLQCTVNNGYTTSCKVTVKGLELGSPVRLSHVKIVCDGLLVRRWRDWPSPRLCAQELDDLVITDCTTGFYVQEIDGSAGMRLVFQNGPPSGAEAGKRLLIDGVSFTSQGERIIMVSSAQVTTNAPQRVVAMPVRSVGGGDWYWNPIMHSGQQGVVGGIGLNNIGLLVRTWGKYTQVNSTTFTLDDGSGTPLRCEVPSTVTLQEGWTYVVATGVSSMDMIDGQPTRVLRLRIQDDVQSIL